MFRKICAEKAAMGAEGSEVRPPEQDSSESVLIFSVFPEDFDNQESEDNRDIGEEELENNLGDCTQDMIDDCNRRERMRTEQLRALNDGSSPFQQKTTRITFGRVHVREYQRTLGGSCILPKGAIALAINSEYETLEPQSVESYEAGKQLNNEDDRYFDSTPARERTLLLRSCVSPELLNISKKFETRLQKLVRDSRQISLTEDPYCVQQLCNADDVIFVGLHPSADAQSDAHVQYAEGGGFDRVDPSQEIDAKVQDEAVCTALKRIECEIQQCIHDRNVALDAHKAWKEAVAAANEANNNMLGTTEIMVNAMGKPIRRSTRAKIATQKQVSTVSRKNIKKAGPSNCKKGKKGGKKAVKKNDCKQSQSGKKGAVHKNRNTRSSLPVNTSRRRSRRCSLASSMFAGEEFKAVIEKYTEMSVSQLTELLRERNLPMRGDKHGMARRLAQAEVDSSCVATADDFKTDTEALDRITKKHRKRRRSGRFESPITRTQNVSVDDNDDNDDDDDDATIMLSSLVQKSAASANTCNKVMEEEEFNVVLEDLLEEQSEDTSGSISNKSESDTNNAEHISVEEPIPSQIKAEHQNLVSSIDTTKQVLTKSLDSLKQDKDCPSTTSSSRPKNSLISESNNAISVMMGSSSPSMPTANTSIKSPILSSAVAATACTSPDNKSSKGSKSLSNHIVYASPKDGLLRRSRRATLARQQWSPNNSPSKRSPRSKRWYTLSISGLQKELAKHGLSSDGDKHLMIHRLRTKAVTPTKSRPQSHTSTPQSQVGSPTKSIQLANMDSPMTNDSIPACEQSKHSLRPSSGMACADIVRKSPVKSEVTHMLSPNTFSSPVMNRKKTSTPSSLSKHQPVATIASNEQLNTRHQRSSIRDSISVHSICSLAPSDGNLSTSFGLNESSVHLSDLEPSSPDSHAMTSKVEDDDELKITDDNLVNNQKKQAAISDQSTKQMVASSSVQSMLRFKRNALEQINAPSPMILTPQNKQRETKGRPTKSMSKLSVDTVLDMATPNRAPVDDELESDDEDDTPLKDIISKRAGDKKLSLLKTLESREDLSSPKQTQQLRPKRKSSKISSSKQASPPRLTSITGISVSSPVLIQAKAPKKNLNRAKSGSDIHEKLEKVQKKRRRVSVSNVLPPVLTLTASRRSSVHHRVRSSSIGSGGHSNDQKLEMFLRRLSTPEGQAFLIKTAQQRFGGDTKKAQQIMIASFRKGNHSKSSSTFQGSMAALVAPAVSKSVVGGNRRRRTRAPQIDENSGNANGNSNQVSSYAAGTCQPRRRQHNNNTTKGQRPNSPRQRFVTARAIEAYVGKELGAQKR